MIVMETTKKRVICMASPLQKLSFWIGICFFLGVGHAVTAQEAASELIWAEKIFDRSKGLEDKPVHQVFEDRRGYFWLVTDASLVFFDGVNFFTVMSYRPSQRVGNMHIRCQDADGRIWVQYEDRNGSGFKVFDEYDRSELGTPVFFPEGIALNGVKDVTMDEEGDFFLLTRTGELWRHAHEAQNWQLAATCISPDFSFAFPMQNSSGVWIISEKANREAHRVLGHWIPGRVNYFDIKDLIHVASTESDKLLCVTKTSLGLLHENGDFERIALESLFPGFDLGKDGMRSYNSSFGYNRYTGDVFLLYDGKLKLANLRTDLPYSSFNQPFLQSTYTGVFTRDNNIWFGTLEGLKQLEFRINAFDRIQWKDPSMDQFSHEYSVRGIAACPNGKIFFSANNYLWSYDPLSRVTERLLFTNNGTSDVIWDADNSRIWMLGNGELVGYGPFGKTVETYPIPEAASNGYTFGLYSMGDSLFLSNSHGSWVLHLADRRFEPFGAYGDFPEVKTADIYGFFEYSPTVLLLYSNQGIYRWEKEGGVTTHYSVFGEGETYIPALDIRHIHRDENGVIWLASREGLVRWEPELGRSQLITEEDGLYDSNLYGIFEDRHGFLWLSSNYGIIQYHKATGISRNFTTEHGISHNEFNRISHEQDGNGYIYFGSLNGITGFDPDGFVFDPGNLAAKSIDLVSLGLYDRQEGVEVVKTRSFFADRRIEILPREISMNASFAVNDYDIAGGVSYAYRLLDGKNDQWIEMASPALQIPSLPYGKYDIEIRARDGDLEFKDSYLRIPLNVIPPLYLRPWFILTGVLGFFAVLVWAAAREIRRRDEQNRILQDLVAKSTAQIRADKQLIEEQAAELQRQNLEKDHFFANISHEFRTPIALILGPAGLLEERFRPSSREFGLLQTIKHNAQRLLKLINDVLILSKLDYSPSLPKEEVLDINALFEEISGEFESLFARKQVNFKKAYREDEPIWIKSDKQFLKIILHNLLSNALKFTPVNREVTLGLCVEETGILIKVTDTGRGIHPDDLPHIFERYFQSNRKEGLVEGGTGIGLSLVQELVTALGGRVEVSSNWGEGATFSVELPVLYATTPASSSKGKQPVVSHEQYLRRLLPSKILTHIQGRPLLLVEDNPDFYDYIQQILGGIFDVKYAGSGKEAMILLKGGLQPVMIITDLMMPEMDGLALLSRLKSSPEFRDIPVVALTAMAEDQSRMDAFSLGVNDYLLKPFDSRQLLVVVGHLLEQQFSAKLAQNTTDDQTDAERQETAEWLKELKQVIEKGIASEDYSVEKLTIQMSVSRSALYYKVKSATGLTPNQLMMEVRLQKARTYLTENPQLTNKQVMKLVGLKHESYFIRVFTRRFGYSPGQMKN
jgi:signal transduction histidine kinase/CheY-like chemotaxis protein/ligand-binding sensor domain-containing protein